METEQGRGSSPGSGHWVERAGLAALAGSVLAIAGSSSPQSVGRRRRRLRRAARTSTSTARADRVSRILQAIGSRLLAGAALLPLPAAEARSPTRPQASSRPRPRSRRSCSACSAILMRPGPSRRPTTTSIGDASRPSRRRRRGGMRGRAQRQRREGFADEFGERGAGPAAACAPEGRGRQGVGGDRRRRARHLRPFTGLAGGLALLVALFYTCLQAMRTGLLTRFWGSLGMARRRRSLIGFRRWRCSGSSTSACCCSARCPAAARRPGSRAKRSPGRRPAEKAAAELEGPAGGARRTEADDLGRPRREPRRKRKQRD